MQCHTILWKLSSLSSCLNPASPEADQEILLTLQASKTIAGGSQLGVGAPEAAEKATEAAVEVAGKPCYSDVLQRGGQGRADGLLMALPSSWRRAPVSSRLCRTPHMLG